MSEADSADEPMTGEDLPAVEEVPEPEAQSDTEPEPGDTTEPETESVPEESDDEPEIPGRDADDESPAEELTDGEDTGTVEGESREEEADTVPFSDPQPSSKDVSEGATDLASDDEDDDRKV
jgi:hypothetical protein